MIADPSTTDRRTAQEIFAHELQELQLTADRAFSFLLLGQWLFAVVCAAVISPQTWVGESSWLHTHMWAAIFLGGALSLFPCWLVYRHRNNQLTRLLIASSQVMYSALLIHLMGGRIEAHFHIFGSLALLSFYRDRWVFLPAVLLIAVDHLLRGVLWPESVFGVLTPSAWRALEHAGWVLFETTFLLWGVSQSRRQLMRMAQLQVAVSNERDQLEQRVVERTSELAEERKLLAAIINSLPHPVYWKDCNSTYLGCNEEFAGYVGLSSTDEIIGMNDEQLNWSLEDAVENRREDLRIMSSGEAMLNCEQNRTSSDGEERVFWASKTPMRGRTDGRFGLVAVINDVTEIRHAEAQRDLLQSRLTQSQKLESVGQLAAGVAHEINTPMQFVGDNLEYLSECSNKLFRVVDVYHAMFCEEAPPLNWHERKQEVERLTTECRFDRLRKQVPDAIEESLEGVQRTVKIVQAMKEFSHPGSREKTLCNLNALIESTVAISRNRWKYAAELRLELDSGLPEVPVLASEINQVLLNLIVNAGDAIAEKNEGKEGVLGNITVRTYSKEDSVVVEIEDDGCGMPQEVQQKVFDPFYTTKEVGKGTGQGLAITHNVVVNMHHGIIHLESKEGVGSVFTLELLRDLGDSTDPGGSLEPSEGLAQPTTA